MPEVVSLAATRHATLMEVALTILDEEGQTDVSMMLEAGQLGHAQARLTGAVDRLMLDRQLDGDEADDLRHKIGLPLERAEDLRTASAALW